MPTDMPWNIVSIYFIVDIILEKTKNGDMSGMTFADNIREIERYKATPIIFTTSLEDPKLHAYAHLHCYQYFDKYYREDELQRSSSVYS